MSGPGRNGAVYLGISSRKPWHFEASFTRQISQSTILETQGLFNRPILGFIEVWHCSDFKIKVGGHSYRSHYQMVGQSVSDITDGLKHAFLLITSMCVCVCVLQEVLRILLDVCSSIKAGLPLPGGPWWPPAYPIHQPPNPSSSFPPTSQPSPNLQYSATLHDHWKDLKEATMS